MTANNFSITFVLLLLIPLIIGSTNIGIYKLKSGVVKITGEDDNAPIEGSGFIVKLNSDFVYILTASHVIEGTNTLSVEFYTYSDGRTHKPSKAEVIGIDEDNDIALLRVEGKANYPNLEKLHAYTFWKFPIYEREEVEIIGIPSFLDDWVIVDGKIVQSGSKIYFTGCANPGISGGPLIKNDQVLGLVNNSPTGMLGCATPATIIELFLKDMGIML